MSNLPKVVIVGRINVGKSSLFNRLTETTKALVSSISGTTRDYNVGHVAWRKKVFELIDTGGVNIDILKNSIQSLVSQKEQRKLKQIDKIDREIIDQTRKSLDKADLILMVIDAQAGLLPEDKELALVLKKLNKPVILVANKVDTQKQIVSLPEFFKLGLGAAYPVSAINGSGTGDFLDELVKKIKWPVGRPVTKTEKEIDSVKVAIIGKPNTGKSSLVNKILGEKRVIVSPVAHTTREPQDTLIDYKGEKITIIDTAGLRKKAKIEQGLEKLSTKKSLDMARTADVVIFVSEADEPLSKQDAALAGLIKEAGAGMLIVANKWDLIEEKDTHSDKEFRMYYQKHFPFLSFAPLLFTSAKTGKNVEKILEIILQIYKEKNKIVPEEKLEELAEKIVKRHRPTQAKGSRRPHIYGIKQTATNPPVFTVTIKKDDTLHFSYFRFIENQIREKFGFVGVPVKINTRELIR